MDTNIFDINDIINITMSMVDDLEKEELYGIEEDSLDISQNLNSKLELLGDEDCEELLSTIDEIAKQVYELKSGELHELNIIHKEIINLAIKKLKKYIN